MWWLEILRANKYQSYPFKNQIHQKIKMLWCINIVFSYHCSAKMTLKYIFTFLTSNSLSFLKTDSFNFNMYQYWRPWGILNLNFCPYKNQKLHKKKQSDDNIYNAGEVSLKFIYWLRKRTFFLFLTSRWLAFFRQAISISSPVQS